MRKRKPTPAAGRKPMRGLKGFARAARAKRVRREASRRYKHAMRDEARAHGFCAYCFKEPANEGRTLCSGCREKERARYRRRVSRPPSPGVCTHCRSGRAVDGCKWCARCRRKTRIRERWHRRQLNKKTPRILQVAQLLSLGSMEQRRLTAEMGCSHRQTLRALSEMQASGLVLRWTSDGSRTGRGMARLTGAGRKLLGPPSEARYPNKRRAA